MKHCPKHTRPRGGIGRALGIALFYTGLLSAFNARSQEGLIGEFASFWDIPLGSHALELDPLLFTGYACGTNGGPPSTLIRGWADYALCAAEPSTGLHEVQFRHDDEPEYLARAFGLGHLVATYAGTKLFTFAAIVSALFDDDGFLVGLRAVTDARVDDEERLRSISFRNFMMARFDPFAWACEDLPRAEGETPMGARFLKERCTRSTETLALTVESHLYRKAGQVGINPRTNQPVSGQFESLVRFEMMLAQPIEGLAERLAASAANPRPPSEPELNRQRALNCPGCDLTGLNLKRQDLTGANLAGANLSGANLHGAILVQANLAGANLAGANLNRSNLRQAQMAGAILTDVLLYGAVMDRADLSGADISHAKAQEARLTLVNLDNARAVAVDFSRARLSSVTARSTNFGGTWFYDAQMSRGDFTGADFLQAILQNVVLTDANLTRANFNGADLIQADLRGANLTGTDFTNARLTQARMANTNRQDAIMQFAFDPPP